MHLIWVSSKGLSITQIENYENIGPLTGVRFKNSNMLIAQSKTVTFQQKDKSLSQKLRKWMSPVIEWEDIRSI